MLIGLTGYSGSGKDTAAAYLKNAHGFGRSAFADKLRELVYAQDPWLTTCSLRYAVDAVGWDKAKRVDSEIRELLQSAGQAHREVFGEDFWVDQVLPDCKAYLEHFYPRRLVITDVRYPNEAARIRDLGGTVVRIERPGVGPVNSHESEQQLPDVDVAVQNIDGQPSVLYRHLDLMMNKLEGK